MDYNDKHFQEGILKMMGEQQKEVAEIVIAIYSEILNRLDNGDTAGIRKACEDNIADCKGRIAKINENSFIGDNPFDQLNALMKKGESN